MNQKTSIIIFGVIVVLIIMLLINSFQKGNLKPYQENIEEHTDSSEDIVSFYNEEKYEYEIKDNITGEVITSTMDEQTLKYELEFYKGHPNYKANPPIEDN